MDVKVKRYRFFTKSKFIVAIPNDNYYKTVHITSFEIIKRSNQDLLIKIEKRIGNWIRPPFDNDSLSPGMFGNHYVSRNEPIYIEGYSELLLIVFIKNDKNVFVPLNEFGTDKIEKFSIGFEYVIE